MFQLFGERARVRVGEECQPTRRERYGQGQPEAQALPLTMGCAIVSS